MLKQLGGGFSGAYVVKAQPSDRGKTFVLKIDEEPKKLKRELEGYRTITSYVSHDYYLPIVDASSPVTLAAEWWATFLMPYEGNAKPLIEHIDVGGPELAELYRSIWEKCLFDLYGTVTSKDVSSEVIDGAEALRLAKSGLHGLHRYLSIAKRFLALIWAGQLVDAKW
ncbi:MAG: hypothetical protein ACREYF_28390 [Gammaproteobacteria bacterium]